jgi:hypothetical protein
MDILLSIGDGIDPRTKEAQSQASEIANNNCKRYGKVPPDTSVKDMPPSGNSIHLHLHA